MQACTYPNYLHSKFYGAPIAIRVARLCKVHGEKITLLVVEKVVTRIEYSLGILEPFQNLELRVNTSIKFSLGRMLKVGNLTSINAYIAFVVAFLGHKHVNSFCAR